MSRLRVVIPFDSDSTQELGNLLDRIRKAAQFTPVPLKLPPPVAPAFRLLNLAVPGMPSTEADAREFLERLAAEITVELDARSAAPPVLKFSSVALVPDPKQPRALALMMDASRRTLRSFTVALDRMGGVPADAFSPPSITLSALPTAKGTSALHSILSRGLPPFCIEVPCHHLELRRQPPSPDDLPEILLSVPLLPSP